MPENPDPVRRGHRLVPPHKDRACRLTSKLLGCLQGWAWPGGEPGRDWLAVRSRHGGRVRISLGDVSLWFDVSGPSVIPRGATPAARPVLVAVRGGPGLIPSR